MTIDSILARRKIIVTCGTGGVGKTTLSAALAFRAAYLGKRAVVITIDPAKRLATSLGLKSLGDDPTDLTPALKRALLNSRTAPSDPALLGTISAVIPDTRRTFELFAREISPTPEIAERVLQNPVFQLFAQEFSGANEYMALQRLHALERSGLYDCIILDTPPSRNTLDFLDAPKLLARFFEEKMIRWLVTPTNKIVSAGMKKALGVLENLTGAGFMTNLVDFAAGLFELQPGFTSHLQRMISLLESEEVGFIVVSSLNPDMVPEARHFLRSLEEHRFHFDGVALNRTISGLAFPKSGGLAREPALDILAALQERERAVLAELQKHRIDLCAQLPELARDVHSVEDLLYVALAFDSARSAPAIAAHA